MDDKPSRLLSRSLAAVSSLFSRTKKPCPICRDFHVESLNRVELDLVDLRRGCHGCALLLRALDLLAQSMNWEVPKDDGARTTMMRVTGGPLILDAVQSGLSPPVIGARLFIDPSFGVSPWPDMVLNRVSMDALSSECMQLAQKWLSDCDESHAGCLGRTVEKGWLPKRLIHVGDGQNNPRLVVDTSGLSTRYIALSHSWGKSQPLRLTSSTMTERQAGMPLSSMPHNFQDAVRVTRRLGFDYIWIDSLCIIQDSKVDWEEQSAQMQNVYEGAVLTIAADASRDSTAGFTSANRKLFNGIRIPGENFFVAPTIQTSDTPAHTPEFHFRPPREVDSVLQTRGWAFQERLLSPRMLHFGEYEMAWECRTTTACECNDQQLVRIGEPPWRTIYNADWCFRSDEPDLTLITRWMMLVQRYTSRDLTFSSDKLPALSGLAARASRAKGWSYVAGLWVEQLAATLLWTAGHLPSGITGGRRHEAYQCPTWSWASTHGCEIHHNIDPLFQPSAVVLRAACTLRPGNKFGPVEDGYLELDCLTAPASISRHEKITSDGRALEPGEVLPVEEMMKVVTVVDAAALTEPASTSTDVKGFEEFSENEYLFLRIGHRDFTPNVPSQGKTLGYSVLHSMRIVRGLIVRRSDRRKGAFERIGVHQYMLSPEHDNLHIYKQEKVLVV